MTMTLSPGQSPGSLGSLLWPLHVAAHGISRRQVGTDSGHPECLTQQARVYISSQLQVRTWGLAGGPLSWYPVVPGYCSTP